MDPAGPDSRPTPSTSTPPGTPSFDEGPKEDGPIVGYDAGLRQTGFSNGAYDVLAASGSVTGADVWKVMQPTMFVTFDVATVPAPLATVHVCAGVVG